MPLFSLLRNRLSGRSPVNICSAPSWNQSLHTSTSEENARLQQLNTFFGNQSELLRQVSSAWKRGDFKALNQWLQECSVYLDPNKPHLLACFLGLGGIDLFVTLLCDVNVPTQVGKAQKHRVRFREANNCTPSRLVRVIASVMRVLVELLVCHNDLGWYFYDRFPGLFFRLLELARVPQLQATAFVMLEHLVLSVGPVLEISKVPILQELIRTSDDVTLALLCRVIALLIVPGVVLNQCDSPHKRLAFPDSLLPLWRIQRVIDSNVLWLIGEKDFIRRLVRMCEVRSTSNRRSATSPERNPFSTLRVAVMQSLMEFSTSPIVGMPQTGGLFLPNMSFDNRSFELAVALSRADSRNNGNTTDSTTTATSSTNSNNNNSRSDNSNLLNRTQVLGERDDVAEEGGTETTEDVMLQQIFDFSTVMEILTNDNTVLAAPVLLSSLNVDFSWFVGCTDAKQRWRLRDLTLRAEVDDNRPLLCGFGPITDKKAYDAFKQQNSAFWNFLKPLTQLPVYSHTQEVIIGAQSEILFVLNLMLSTFFFGDVWCALRDCNWIDTASRFYDAAFDSRFTQQTISPYLEQLWNVPELGNLPRFLAPGAASEGAERGGGEEFCGREAEREGRNTNNINSSESGERRRQQERFPFVEHLADDTEAFIRHTMHHGMIDDDDGFDDKNHQHEPNTIRKLELLRGVQEFWNAQDRYECCMLYDGDKADSSASLALKIAIMLAEGNEDSCVETTACYALESYLRCFSFRVREKTSATSPQTVLGKVLLRSVLEHRVYNATYVPGLKGSLFPSKRIDSFFALLGELVRYHHKNLTILQDYMLGSVSLQYLNNPSVVSSHVSQLHVSSEHVERLLRLPPLDRQECEPFARVILRRMHRHSCDTNLFLRSLLLSLTPGLRSKINYIWKGASQDTVDAKELLNSVARIGDVVTGHPRRLSYIGKHSREFVAILSERQRAAGRGSQHETDTNVKEERDTFFNPSLHSSALTLWEMLQILLSCPHRLSLEERPFPRFFDDYDRALIMGDVDLPSIGPPQELVVPLFPEMGGDGGDGLCMLVELEKMLLHEPHQLVYNMLGPLNAERIQNAGRLCVVTTCVFVFVRAARMGGAGAVHEILRKLRPLAMASHEKWKKQRDTLTHCARRLAGGVGRAKDSRGRPATGEGTASRYCCASDGAARCEAFLIHGHCAPMGASEKYHHTYGGCFFRNMFRLMCVWVGHYGACQRYVETLYYCTEVPFAEPKCIVLYLMRVLPDYFL